MPDNFIVMNYCSLLRAIQINSLQRILQEKSRLTKKHSLTSNILGYRIRALGEDIQLFCDKPMKYRSKNRIRREVFGYRLPYKS